MLAERERLEPMPWDFGTGSGESTFIGDGFGCGRGGGGTGNGATFDPDVRHSVGRDDDDRPPLSRFTHVG